MCLSVQAAATRSLARGTNFDSVISMLKEVIPQLSTPIKVEPNEGSASIATSSESVVDALKVKEWEVGMFHNEVAATQGIRIRRRPPTGPPIHYVGPFEFRLENEGNTPRNILEEIIWNKDIEVRHVLYL
ncbi:unnamed protein product [Trifolium pratense]|uniref:Uncharacterized protein n=3 Tax=Trifolium pratense TaxID=57577 RepID=A0ACB0LZE3_TRIPR|nr:unnamed protein product [Trifolium pratense]